MIPMNNFLFFKFFVLNKIKSLAGDTIIYGGGTILVRLLNWFLMPYYIRTMDETQYGFVTEIYSYIAILLVILTYGFETSFFRFSRKDNFKTVFTTTFSCISFTSVIFLVLAYFFVSNYNFNNTHHLFQILLYLGCIIASFDAVTSILFAKLRYQGKSVKFALLKLINVLTLIGFNIFFLIILPQLKDSNHFFFWLYRPNFEAVYVLVSNLIASFFIFILLLKELHSDWFKFDISLLKGMFKYSFPILIVGITGMLNQNLDKILIPRLLNEEHAYEYLAIYGANFKIGVLMAMFTQSFRMAFEPFFFKHHSDTNDTSVYNKILVYFTLFGFIIFLGVVFNMNIINILLIDKYIKGNIIIPFILFAQLLSGIYFTLSVWYKLSDRTIYGAYMGIIGSIITILFNIVLIPLIGFLGGAITSIFCYGSMVLLSVLLGKKYFPIYYNWKKIIVYFLLTLLVFILGMFIVPALLNFSSLDIQIANIFKYIIRITLLVVFLGIIYIKEFKGIINMKYGIKN